MQRHGPALSSVSPWGMPPWTKMYLSLSSANGMARRYSNSGANASRSSALSAARSVSGESTSPSSAHISRMRPLRAVAFWRRRWANVRTSHSMSHPSTQRCQKSQLPSTGYTRHFSRSAMAYRSVARLSGPFSTRSPSSTSESSARRWSFSTSPRKYGRFPWMSDMAMMRE